MTLAISTVLVARATEVYSHQGEALVLDPLSWETHHLTPLSWLVFEALLQHSREPAALVALAAHALNEADPAAAAPHVERVVDELLRLGLVTESRQPR